MHDKVSIKQITLIDHTQTLQKEFAALNRTKNLGMMMNMIITFHKLFHKMQFEIFNEQKILICKCTYNKVIYNN